MFLMTFTRLFVGMYFYDTVFYSASAFEHYPGIVTVYVCIFMYVFVSMCARVCVCNAFTGVYMCRWIYFCIRWVFVV